jgi:polyphosphate kinase 2
MTALEPGKHNGGMKDNDKLKRKAYDKELERLHGELVRLQQWVVHEGLKVCIVFEGRDGAGKGGTIKAITERTSPRIFRVVALSAPTEREKSQMYVQRYVERFPAGGEIVIFDRSWYNRAGVEHVMGFCSPKEHKRFLELTPAVEKFIIDGGTRIIKIWLEVSQEEQERRFKARVDDPIRQWKLSPMDIQSYDRWYDYSRARDMMFEYTDSDHAPWHIVHSDDKKRARLNVIAHILSQIPYKKVDHPKVKLPPRSDKKRYDDRASIAGRRLVEQRY